MFCVINRFWLLGWCSALLLPEYTLADEQTVKRFFEEAPIAWGNLDEVYDSTRFTVDIREQVVNNGNVLDENEKASEVVQLGTNVRETGHLGSRSDTTQDKYWSISNDDYQASIGSNPDGHFVISQLLERQREDTFTADYYANVRARPSYCFMQSCIFDCIVGMDGFHGMKTPLAYIVSDATASADKSGQEMLILDLVKAMRDDTGEFREIDSLGFSNPIKLTLVPSRNWCILSYEEKGKAKFASSGDSNENLLPMSMSCQFEFSGDTCHPSRKKEVTKIAGTSQIQECEYGPLEPTKVSKTDFRLTGFDLPEPSFLVANSNSRFYYWIFGAIGTLALGYWIFRFR